MESLTKLINRKCKALESEDPSLNHIFNIIHDSNEATFCEYISSYKVKSISYKQNKEYCYKMATFLETKISVPKGSYVGLLMENSVNWIATFWGLLISGYKPVLLNAKLPVKINAKIITLVNVTTVVTDESFKNYGLKANLVVLPKTVDLIDEVLTFEKYNDDLWEDEFVISSTATSLNVKVCFYSGKEVVNQIKNTKSILTTNRMMRTPYQGKIKNLAFLPFYHIFGLMACYFWFSFFSQIIVFLTDYSSDVILKTIRKLKVTHVFAVPLLWHTIYKEITKSVAKKDEKTQAKYEKGLKISYKIQRLFPRLGLKLASKMFKEIKDQVFGDSIKFMISGGGYISDKALNTINCIGYPLYVGYGTTEVGITSVELRKNIKHRVSGSVGKPLDSVTYKIEDDVLFIKGSSTANKIIYQDVVHNISNKDWYKTYDLVRKDEKGNYYILGRQDDLFIGVNGEKINPDLIEKELNFINISKFSVLNLNLDNVNALSLVIELESGINQIKLNNVIEEINKVIHTEDFNKYQISQVYFTFDKIANKNAIKVSRKALTTSIIMGAVKLHPIKELNSLEIKDIDDLTKEILKGVKEVFASILDKNINTIEDTCNFILDLGGSSLDYCNLISELSTKFEVSISIEETNSLTPIDFARFIVRKINR